MTTPNRVPMPDGFAWCDIRWADHVCAVHAPGHTEHVCCCGETMPGGAE